MPLDDVAGLSWPSGHLVVPRSRGRLRSGARSLPTAGTRPSRWSPRWRAPWSRRRPRPLHRRPRRRTPRHAPTRRQAHWTRPALVSVCQSTRRQVRTQTASTARPYHRATRARDLGGAEPLLVLRDHDPGRSGTVTAGRAGGESRLPEVGLGRAGAVGCWDASRLARSSSAWDRLRAIGAVTDTLVIDDAGGDDPGPSPARWRGGGRGTRSAAARPWRHGRRLGGRLAEAPHGTRRWRRPAGIVDAAAGIATRAPPPGGRGPRHDRLRARAIAAVVSGDPAAVGSRARGARPAG